MKKEHPKVKAGKMTDFYEKTGPTPDRQTCHINSESICFLCLELLNQLNTPEHCFPLRSIYRYLNINGEEIILARLRSELGEIGDTEKLIAKKMSSDSQKVILCKQCASIIEPLINLCMELELIQMRVHHYLKSVNGVLECSQAMEDSANHAELTRLMRKEMRKKCQIQISHAVPKVMLTNDTSLFLENKILNNKTSPETEYGEREFSPQPLTSEDENSGGVDSDGETETLQHKMSKGSYETLEMKMKKNTKHELCNLCRPPRNVHIKKRNQHEVLFHLDNWFISSKQSNVTQEQFKEYCFHVLKVELISCETLSDEKGNVLAKCPHCPFSDRTGNKLRPLRHHMAAVHKKIISAKLEELQRSTTVEELRAFQFPPGVAFSLSDEERGGIYRKRAFNCDACDKVFHGFASLNKHKIMEHMNGLPEKQDWSCQVCGKVFKSGLILLRHRKKVHKIFPVMHKCQVCGREFKHPSRLSRHIKGVHENNLPIHKCNYCGMEFKYKDGLLSHKKRIHETPRPVSECDICGKVFKRPGHDITKHKLREHNVSGFKCDQCEKSFTHYKSLSKHKRRKHQRQEARVGRLQLSTAKNSDADTATGTKFIQSQNGGQPIVLSKVEILGDSETFEMIQFDDDDVPEVEMKILPD